VSPTATNYLFLPGNWLFLLAIIIAAVYFAAFGPVEWVAAAIMAAGALTGGYLGVGLARRLGRKWLRVVVIGYGLIAASILLAR